MTQTIAPSTVDPALEPVANALIAAASSFYQRGWMLGTSGSVSARLGHDPLQVLITVSGKAKGDLIPQDMLRVTDDGQIFKTLGDPKASSESFYKGQPRPSGETLVHEAIYRKFDDAGAVYHVHSVDNTLCSQLVAPGQTLDLRDLEMLKGLGRWEPGQTVKIPVVPNHLHIPTLAEAVAQAAVYDVPGVLVRGHGIYTWGQDMARARRHTEIFEFLFSYFTRALQLGLVERP